jgi:hypothetical protein
MGDVSGHARGGDVSIVVVSTGLSNTPERVAAKARCLESVRRQTVEHQHIYVEAADQDPPKSAADNFAGVCRALHPNAIIVWVDGDDRLAHDDVLARVAKIYDDPGVWMTYGSYVHGDGRPGITRAYTEVEARDYRHAEWLASHLKTCRAALFQKLGDDDLKIHGYWRELAWDQALMFPMLEMAGPEHSRHVDEVLYVYDFAMSFEFNAKAAGIRLERAASAEIRSLTPKARLASL